MKKRGMHGFWFKHMKEDKNQCGCHCGSCNGGIYFLGVIGSAVYYLQQSATFWQGVVGILKALVWPAFLVYKLLG
jgi:hypothetical protein